MGLKKVGDEVYNAKTIIGGTITGIIKNVEDTGCGFPYSVWGVWSKDGEENLIWANGGEEPAPKPASSEGDEFTVMRVCAAWISGLPSMSERLRVLKYLEDRFEA